MSGEAAQQPMPDYPCQRLDAHPAHLHPVGKTDVERTCPGLELRVPKNTRRASESTVALEDKAAGQEAS